MIDEGYAVTAKGFARLGAFVKKQQLSEEEFNKFLVLVGHCDGEIPPDSEQEINLCVQEGELRHFDVEINDEKSEYFFALVRLGLIDRETTRPTEKGKIICFRELQVLLQADLLRN